MTEPIRPFHCGSQYADWEAGNCTACVNGDQGVAEAEYVWGRCGLRDALSVAYIGDGTISQDIWEKIGGPDHEGHLGWWCPARVPV